MSYIAGSINNNHRKINNVMQWFLFGFLLVALPSSLKVWYQLTIGYNLIYSICLQDISLSVLAICCNFINLCIDTDKYINHFLRWFFGIVSGTVCVICLFLYLFIETSEKFFNFFNKHTNISLVLFKTSFGIILFILITGIIIILYSISKNGEDKYNAK